MGSGWGAPGQGEPAGGSRSGAAGWPTPGEGRAWDAGGAARPYGSSQGPVPTQAVLAGWWFRVGATIIDGIIFTIISLVLDAVFGTGGFRASQQGVHSFYIGPSVYVTVILSVLYATVLIGLYGQTVGMKALGTRVVDRAQGGRIGFGRSFGRAIAYLVLSWIPLVDLADVLWPLWDRNNQTLHDKLVGTLVVLSR